MAESATFLDRNREHQRRSRARRKDYISDLEQRVRKYERDGVKATSEVQAAARKVAEENHSLRSLLLRHGISIAEIDGHINDRGEPILDLKAASARPFLPMLTNVNNQGQQPRSRKALAITTPLSTASANATNGVGLLSSQSARTDLEYEDVLDMTRYSQKTQRHPSISCTDFRGSQLRNDEDQLPSPPYPTCVTPGKGDIVPGGRDETRCEEAAHIIASMRGHNDPEAVWSELGCNDTRRCMVKNMKLFQIVDQEP